MEMSDQVKLAASITGGTVAMGIAYFLFLKNSNPSDNSDKADYEDTLWPMQGSLEEKEALIDAILAEPCMTGAFKDPTRQERFRESTE